MDRIRIPIWVFSVLFVLLIRDAKPEQDDVKQSMINFIEQLSGGNGDQNLGWSMSSDPCTDKWVGVSCDLKNTSVKRIVLEELNFNGVLDPNSLCNKTSSLTVLSIIGNRVSGNLPDGIGNCRQLTHLYLGRNQLSGSLPSSLSRLSNLKRLDISSNAFSGELPEIGRISGLLSLFAENNDLDGLVPEFDFTNLDNFNVSNNNFSGQVPDVKGRFGSDSFLNNPRLCGELVSNPCPPPPKKKPTGSMVKKVLIYSGYIVLGLIVVLFIAYKVRSRNSTKSKDQNVLAGKGLGGDKKSSNTNSSSSEYKSTSVEGLSPSPLVVLNGGPVVKGLRFEDLLRAPAELLGKGKHGSLYKVLLGGGVTLAVKRIKDWEISKQEFKKRIKRIDQVKHPNLLSAVAFYCSNQEKLLAYEYQQNGSLYKLLHGSQNGQTYDWGSRLGVASRISEALAFIHGELRVDGIAHGNLKSTNILFKNNMEPCISEYGLMAFENERTQSHSISQSLSCSVFEADVYRFGVILLELLTGKSEESNGADLARWVHSVVSEEWTVEVFDKALLKDGTSEERMVNLLQVALKCISQNPDQRPNMNQIVGMINAIREEEERSTGSDQW